MCGIIAVLRRQSERGMPVPSDVLGPLGEALEVLQGDGDLAERLVAAAKAAATADQLLRGSVGVRALLTSPGLDAGVAAELARLSESVDALDASFEDPSGLEVERVNAGFTAVRDALWSLSRDRIRTAHAVADLAGPNPSPSLVAGFLSVQEALAALDRLEVRGRDSAGIQLLVHNHGLNLADASLRAAQAERARGGLFTSGALSIADGVLSFVYKAAAEIGELGDNTAALRAQIKADSLLHQVLGAPGAEMVVLGHTRWASVGLISEPNAHPLDSAELDRDNAFVTGVLNGDVDNYADLKVAHGLAVAPEITTDAKVIPTLVSRSMAQGSDWPEAFAETVATLDGSVAIGASSASRPAELMLALRGSGQALYIGIAEDSYIIASEPYGVVEVAERYLRMDGETPADLDNPIASRGQIIKLDGAGAGTLEGIDRLAYDGTPLPVSAADFAAAEITTRDIDRGEYPHYLLKEITESQLSARKTMRGKLVADGDLLKVKLTDAVIGADVRDRLRSGSFARVLVIGQGTAAVAGQGLAMTLTDLVEDLPIQVTDIVATELSGFRMRSDMSDTLVIAISQSGTTTDTNRTVDLVRGRGAAVLAIVNRRSSDLTDKSDGVLYTSDGRDVEMSVASTKAFYAQIFAGVLLAVAIAGEVGVDTKSSEVQSLLRALQKLPDAMSETLELRPQIADIARRHAPSRRYWAVVGNGPNRIAAQEVRIKLSELCYKSIAADYTEDKKHIDLSSEPMIIVCAAGLSGSTADDVSKEVAIYRAHKAAPIVIGDAGSDRYSAALDAIGVPPIHPKLGYVLSAMVGHLFGYEAALAIDAQALPLREARAAIEQAAATGEDADAALKRLAPILGPKAAKFLEGLRSGAYDGHLEAGTATKLVGVLRYATGVAQLDTYQVEMGKVGTPSVVIEDLAHALTRAIEELTRPVDAIKHQAKTVTVGISRSDESLMEIPLVAAVLSAGTHRDRLSYSTLRTLADLDPAVDEILGYTRYSISGDPVSSEATLVVAERGGIARDLVSRTDRNPQLRGTKHLAAVERRATVARGRTDDRDIIIVPTVADGVAVGITLMHVRLLENLTVSVARSVLSGYRNRYSALRDIVSEVEPHFREDLLAEIPARELLTSSIYELADNWTDSAS